MKFCYTSCLLMILFTPCYTSDGENTVECDPHQYLEIGTSATIDCSITKPFQGVYWYNSSDSRTNYPSLIYENNTKSGPSYLSGDFDVDHDGSLVINNVSLVHEHLFKVVVVYVENADTLEAVVRVSVKVKPLRDFPLIDQCGGVHTCLRKLQHVTVLSCRVEGARPAVNLTWVTRNIDGDVHLNSKSYYIRDGVTTTTVANITVDSKIVNVLALFICSAEFSYNIMRRTESQIIIENPTYNTADIQPTTVLFKMHANQTLSCEDDDSLIFVWKKKTSANMFETILLSTMENSTVLTEGYSSMSNGVLTLRDIGVRDEGIYICFYGNGISGGYQFYDLSVFDYEEVHVFPTFAKVIVIVLPLFIVIALFAFFILRYRRVRGKRENPKRNQQQTDGTESVRMLEKEPHDTVQSKKPEFVQELKEIYQNLCYRWSLLPSVANKKVSIQDGFVKNTLHQKDLPSQDLNSHHEIFGNECSKRIFLIGDPGMGKTTIALKAAYEWCEKNPSSPLKDIDIFILIRLKYIRGTTSIYETIKKNLLPNNSELEEDDIKSIISSCSSLVFVFDGYDEYFAELSSDVLKIIEGSLLPEATVITTTIPSFLPERTEREVTKIYIKGFNESARSDYINKVHEKGGDGTFGAGNVYLKHLSNVPLFFSLLTYMKHNSLDLQQISSVTHLFDCFIGMAGEEKQLDSDSNNAFCNDLYEKAFQSLKSSQEQISLLSDDYVKDITEHFYDRYVTIGVFEEDYNHSQSSGEIDNSGKLLGGINFSHRLFQEWFAAHHLVKLLKETPEGVENYSLKEIKPRRQPYLLRFASGLSKTAASRIIEYVINDEDCVSLAILCAFEKDGKCTHMEDAIRKLCSKPLKFQKGDSELLQHSTTELLKFASHKMITVSSLEFHSSLPIFLAISQMKSEHWETPLRTVRHLALHEPERGLSTNEVVTAIKISLCCKDLEILSFISRRKPKNIEREDIVCKLKDVKLRVNWTRKDQNMYFSIHFILNQDTGRWEAPGTPRETPITPGEGTKKIVWSTQQSITDH
ncbi:hypothetical protein HOLleu_00743 [Holothuria leucospilota]|uniref:NLR family CARD domain-containing protein 4 n=1 Tax=Holothuria leucospilota TaxID=206669 RepID=A0A9Q1CPD6_HOLLE|nr:hypothetical protein HOLleu_00743 [Holothuria leucospilota]